jgi:hypothetical protein
LKLSRIELRFPEIVINGYFNEEYSKIKNDRIFLFLNETEMFREDGHLHEKGLCTGEISELYILRIGS